MLSDDMLQLIKQNFLLMLFLVARSSVARSKVWEELKNWGDPERLILRK